MSSRGAEEEGASSREASLAPMQPGVARSRRGAHIGLARAAAVGGQWITSQKKKLLPDPMTGKPFQEVPDTQVAEADAFIQSLRSVPKSGVHNPFKNPER